MNKQDEKPVGRGETVWAKCGNCVMYAPSPHTKGVWVCWLAEVIRPAEEYCAAWIPAQGEKEPIE